MERLINIITELKDVVVISNNIIKQNLIKRISASKQLSNVTFKNFNEVIDDLIGSYLIAARINLAKEENITPEFADIKLKNSLMINPIYQNQKVYNLNKIKVKYRMLLDYNSLAVNIYKDRIVFVVNDYKANDLLNRAIEIISEHTHIVFYKTQNKYKKKITINEFDNIKSEIIELSREVAKLLEAKVDSSKIRIHKLPENYIPYAKQVFALTNIDVDFSTFNSLYEYEISKQALDILNRYINFPILEAFKLTLEQIKELTNNQNLILNAITNVFNTYLEYDILDQYIYQDIVYNFKNTYKQLTTYDNQIKVSNLFEEVIEKGDYCFILGFNQDVFPKTHVDDEFLTDFEKEKLNLKTSKYKNKQEKLKCQRLINSTKNIYISYPTVTDGKTPISCFYQLLKKDYDVTIEKKIIDYKISYSQRLDILTLGKKLDLFYKYDIKSDELFILNNQYRESFYRKYSHKFTGVDQEFLDNFLQKKLYLSYTSIDEYYKCSFLYYLEKMLKVYRSSNDDALYIGNLFHECLNKMLLEPQIDDLNQYLEQVISEFLMEMKKTPTKKELYFINKYKQILEKLYLNIQKQMKNSDFEIFGLEKEFIVELEKKYPVILKGKIDKVLTKTIDNKKYAVVIDYKSGNTDFDLNRIIYGLNMQILFYFYFLNNYSDDKYHFGGGYLQGVLPNSVFNHDKNSTYEEQFDKHFRLIGYSNLDQEIIKQIDCNFDNDNKFINGLKLKKDNSFDAYSLQKVISEEDFWKLHAIIEERIDQAIENIFNGKFDINPKKLATIDSCAYCSYLDICYRDNSDYCNLEPQKNFDFIKGNL